MATLTADGPIDAFIARWQQSSGAERANFQMFAMELCGLLGVAAPNPARGEDAELNDYCFERGVQFKSPDGTTRPGRIDLYRRGAFVMEAKQSREKGRPKELKLAGQPDLFVPTDYNPRGERNANRGWDQLMISARHQAQEYARALATATEPLSIERIARTFAQGKAVEKRIALTILALSRLGHLSSPDNGASFVLRRMT